MSNICIEQYKCNYKYKHKSKSNTNTNIIQIQILRMSCASNVCKEPNRWGSSEGFASPTIPDCQCQILYHCWHLPNKYCPPFDIYQTKYKSIKENNLGTAKFYRRSPTSKRMYDLSCCPRVISKHTKEQTEIDYKVFIVRF